MNLEPFSSRLAMLIQRARKAARIYASIERSASSAQPPDEEKEAQAREWRTSNEVLVTRLARLMGARQVTAMGPQEVAGIMHQSELEYRQWMDELSIGQVRLVELAQSGDFIAVSRLVRDLVPLKARSQAAQAVVNELRTLLAPHKIDTTRAAGAVSSAEERSEDTGQDVSHSALSPSALSPSALPRTPASSSEHRFLAKRLQSTVLQSSAGEEPSRQHTGSSDNGRPAPVAAKEKVIPLHRLTGER